MSRGEVVFDGSEMDAMLALDPDTLDPEKHYRFCQERTANIGKRRTQGYELVLRSVHGVQLLAEFEGENKSVDDTIRIGDCVLMQCDQSRFDQRTAGKKQLSRLRIDGAGNKLKEMAVREGMRQFGKPVEVVTDQRSKGEPTS